MKPLKLLGFSINFSTKNKLFYALDNRLIMCYTLEATKFNIFLNGHTIGKSVCLGFYRSIKDKTL